MAYKVYVQRISDRETFVESGIIGQDDLTGYLAMVSAPNLFGGGEYQFVITPVERRV